VTVPAVDAQALATDLGPQLPRWPLRNPGLESASSRPEGPRRPLRNNAWLQGLPHSITKHTWDNAVMISTRRPGPRAWRRATSVALQYRERSVEGPIMIVPGHADDCVTSPWVRRGGAAEKIAKGVGFNAGAIRTSDGALVRPRAQDRAHGR
jgi:hypothetical protein